MKYLIHRIPNFNKLFNRMSRAGGNAALAVKNADAIIQKLEIADITLADIGRHTKHGEARIKNCIKYNLGNGYRMISVQRGRYIVLLNIGSHDDCSLWLEKNRGLRIMPDENYDDRGFDLLEKEQLRQAALPESRPEMPEVDEYEEMLLSKLDDKLMKQIFSGLCKGREIGVD